MSFSTYAGGFLEIFFKKVNIFLISAVTTDLLQTTF
jgi:hypothetical protein